MSCKFVQQTCKSTKYSISCRTIKTEKQNIYRRNKKQQKHIQHQTEWSFVHPEMIDNFFLLQNFNIFIFNVIVIKKKKIFFVFFFIYIHMKITSPFKQKKNLLFIHQVWQHLCYASLIWWKNDTQQQNTNKRQWKQIIQRTTIMVIFFLLFSLVSTTVFGTFR